jgi:hypothetical protein
MRNKLTTVLALALVATACDKGRTPVSQTVDVLTDTNDVLLSQDSMVADVVPLTAADVILDRSEPSLIRPSETPVPSPRREARFPEFNDFTGITGLVSDNWFCFGYSGITNCHTGLSVCNRVRAAFVDMGDNPTSCLQRSEVWCYASTYMGTRTASCSTTYRGCASDRDAIVHYNTLHSYSNITQCRAFR